MMKNNSLSDFINSKPLNNDMNRERLKNELATLLSDVYTFKIICDSSNNPPSIIADNKVIIDVYQ